MLDYENKDLWDELLESYGDYLAKQGKPRISILTYQNPNRKLIRFVKEKGITKPNKINKEILEKFQLFYLQKRDFAQETVANYILFISLFFDYLILTGKVKENPAKDIEVLPKPEAPEKQLSHFYTYEEILRRYLGDQKDWVSYAYLNELEKHLKGFFRYLVSNEIKSVYSVTEAILLKYREYLWEEFVNYRANSLVAKSQINRLRCVVRLFRYLFKEGILKDNPAKNLDWKRYYKEILEKAKSLPEQPKPQEDLTEMDKLKLKFLEYELAKGKSPKTIQQYRKGINVFFGFLKEKGIQNLAQINKRILLEYYTYLYNYIGVRGRAASNGYKAHMLLSLRLFFRFLVRFDFLPKDPSLDLEGIRYEDGLPTSYMNEKEVFEVLEEPRLNGNTLTIRDKAIMEVLFSTGIRANELCQLNLEDIDQQQEMIRINHPKGGANHQRVIPIGKVALDYLSHYLQAARPQLENGDVKTLFLSYRGHRLTNDSLLRIVKKYAFESGLRKHITTHSFRVTCATLMLKNGADIRYVQEQLGHKRITSTQVYTRLTPLDLKLIHQRCHPRERKNLQAVKGDTLSAGVIDTSTSLSVKNSQPDLVSVSVNDSH